MNELIAAPPVATTASHRITFVSKRPEFRRMVLRGAMLEFVTVGFYRFWLATDIRRHLWSHTSVDDDAAEYTGASKELLIGFLFALAILAPIYFLYFLVGLEAERMRAFASTPLGLFFYLFTQFAIYRARRYRLTRTVWRGVRFSMTGSGWNYAWRAGLWTLLVGITLGFALPWRQAALERFKMRHTSYGDLQGRFDATGWELFKRGWWLWLLTLLIVFTVGAVPSSLINNLKQPVRFEQIVHIGQITLAVFAFALLCMAFIYPTYKSIEWRWWVAGLHLGGVSFESDLKRRSLIGLYWKVIGWMLLIFVAVSILLSIVVSITTDSTLSVLTLQQKMAIASQQLSAFISFIVIYVIAALTFGGVMRIYLMHDLWKRVVDTVTVHNLAAAESVMAQGQLAGALGEGFGDSFDVVGF